jgi:hypothetical protein
MLQVGATEEEEQEEQEQERYLVTLTQVINLIELEM